MTNNTPTKPWAQMVAEENERMKDKMHLGGHYGLTHVDEGALDFLIETFGIKSLVDIGCGPGGMVQLARTKGLEAIGIDGDDTIERPIDIIIHDYSTAPLKLDKEFDCAWSVEFVEHVDHEYVPNYIATFQSCKVVVMTHAMPKQVGHHHVNCMNFEYWLGIMQFAGFEPMMDATNHLRQRSTMKDIFIKNTGYVFVKRQVLIDNNIPIPRFGLAPFRIDYE